MATQRAPQPAGLIGVLLDRTAPFGDRGDAAMDLSAYDDQAAEAALLEVALDQREDRDIADGAGHSLWQIWSRRGAFDQVVIERLHPEARKFFRDGGV